MTRLLSSLLKEFRIVSLVGPRQAGKTTLVQKELSRDFKYLDLEKSSDYDLISGDIDFFLEQTQKLIVDEAQRLPALFPALRSHLDQFPKKRVILLGSASPALIKNISESLRGRLAILELSPFLVWETQRRISPQKLWVKGAFPPLHPHKSNRFVAQWHESYLKTYLEQDLPALGFKLPSVRLKRLFQMIAHLQGQLLNLSELGASLGINYQTVESYLNIFEGSFLIRRLQPYYVNIGKRLVKTPKIYIRDSGFLHYLLGINFQISSLLSYPKAGFSWEGFVIEQLLTLAKLNDPSAEGFFWKTSGGAEVDLLLKYHGKLLPIEIKLGMQIPNLKGLEQCLSDLNLKNGYVIYMGKTSHKLSPRVTLLPIQDVWKNSLAVFI